MADITTAADIGDAKKAVGFVLGERPAALAGYVVVGVRHDNSFLITGNLADVVSLASVLASAVSDLLGQVQPVAVIIQPD